MTRNNDGFYLMPYLIIVSSTEIAAHIDWVGAMGVLFKTDETATVELVEKRFAAAVCWMPDEDYAFVMQAYRHFADTRKPLSFAERMVLARVCRRIIREAKESERK